MSDKVFASARRALEISREIRRQVQEANMEMDERADESARRLNQLEKHHGCRITNLERRVDTIDSGVNVDTATLGNSIWAGGAGVRDNQRRDA